MSFLGLIANVSIPQRVRPPLIRKVWEEAREALQGFHPSKGSTSTHTRRQGRVEGDPLCQFPSLKGFDLHSYLSQYVSGRC